MPSDNVKVWDLFVRVFHWSLVVLFVLSYWTGEEEHPIHVWSGYGILILLVLRIAWGFVGAGFARFQAFQWSPRAALAYLSGLARGSAQRSLGHNPAASWMALLLMLSLLATGASGLALHGSKGEGPLAGLTAATAVQWLDDSVDSGHEDSHKEEEEHEEGSELLEEGHEFFVSMTLLLICLHLAGVLFSSFAHRENLVRAMISGRKRGL